MEILISNYMKACSASFPRGQSASVLYPKLLSEYIKGQHWLMTKSFQSLMTSDMLQLAVLKISLLSQNKKSICMIFILIFGRRLQKPGNFLNGKNDEAVLTFITYHLEPHLWSYLPPSTLMGLFILFHIHFEIYFVCYHIFYLLYLLVVVLSCQNISSSKADIFVLSTDGSQTSRTVPSTEQALSTFSLNEYMDE